MEDNNKSHTVIIALMQLDISNIKKDISKILENFEDIPVKIALHDQSISRIWKFVWAILFTTVGGVATAIAAVILNNVK